MTIVPQPQPDFLTDKKFRFTCSKSASKEYFCEISAKSDQRFQRRRLFNNIFMSISCTKLPFAKAMFIAESKFQKQFLITQEQFCKIISNLTSGFKEEDFLKSFLCLYSASSPHSPEPCLLTDQNFARQFCKGSPKEHSNEIISKSDHPFPRRRFFLEFLHVSIM